MKPTARPRGVACPKTDVASANLNPRRCAWAQGGSSGSPLIWDRTHRVRGSLHCGGFFNGTLSVGTTTRHTAHAVATVVACCFHSETYRAHSMPASDGAQAPRRLLWAPEGLEHNRPHRAHSRLPVVGPNKGALAVRCGPIPVPMWGQGEPSPAGCGCGSLGVHAMGNVADS